LPAAAECLQTAATGGRPYFCYKSVSSFAQ
jgi:hypothetical protein